MNCQACQDLLQQRLDGVAVEATADLDQHIHSCDACRGYHEAWSRLERGLHLLRPAVPPCDLASRVVNAVQADRFRVHRVRLRTAVGLAIAASAFVAVSLWMYRQSPPAPVESNKIAQKPKETPASVRVVSETPRQSVESAVDAVTALTTETTAATVAQTKRLLPLVVEPALRELPLEPAVPNTTLFSVREAGHGASEAIDPMTDHAKRFADMVRRDFLPEVTTKPGS